MPLLLKDQYNQIKYFYKYLKGTLAQLFLKNSAWMMMMMVVSIIDDNEDDEDDEARLHEGSAQGGDCSGASPDTGIGKSQVRKYHHHLTSS